MSHMQQRQFLHNKENIRSMLEKFPDCFSYKTTKYVTTINLCALSLSIAGDQI